jgi:hypothetical protein
MSKNEAEKRKKKDFKLYVWSGLDFNSANPYPEKV